MVALMVALLVVGLLPAVGTGQLNPTRVTLEATPAHTTINTTENNSATFDCSIQVNTLPIVVTTVNVTVDAGEWLNESSQTNFVLTGNRAADFTVSVYALYDSDAGYTQYVDITASWTTSLNEQGTEDVQVDATVEQTFRVNIYASQNYRSAKPGESFKITTYISNGGNGEDGFSVKVTDNTALLTAGWTFSLDKSRVELDAGDQAKVELTVKIPSSAAIGRVEFRVNASSEGAEDMGLEEYDDVPIYINVKEESTNGNGTNGNGDDGKKEEGICATNLIPLAIVVPLWAGIAGSKRRRRRGGPR